MTFWGGATARPLTTGRAPGPAAALFPDACSRRRRSGSTTPSPGCDRGDRCSARGCEAVHTRLTGQRRIIQPAASGDIAMRNLALAMCILAPAAVLSSCNLSDGQDGRPERTFKTEVSLGETLAFFPRRFPADGDPASHACVRGDYTHVYETSQGLGGDREVWLCCIPVDEILSDSFRCADSLFPALFGDTDYPRSDTAALRIRPRVSRNTFRSASRRLSRRRGSKTRAERCSGFGKGGRHDPRIRDHQDPGSAPAVLVGAARRRPNHRLARPGPQRDLVEVPWLLRGGGRLVSHHPYQARRHARPPRGRVYRRGKSRD